MRGSGYIDIFQRKKEPIELDLYTPSEMLDILRIWSQFNLWARGTKYNSSIPGSLYNINIKKENTWFSFIFLFLAFNIFIKFYVCLTMSIIDSEKNIHHICRGNVISLLIGWLVKYLESAVVGSDSLVLCYICTTWGGVFKMQFPGEAMNWAMNHVLCLNSVGLGLGPESTFLSSTHMILRQVSKDHIWKTTALEQYSHKQVSQEGDSLISLNFCSRVSLLLSLWFQWQNVTLGHLFSISTDSKRKGYGF